MGLHAFLDWDYGPDGDDVMQVMVADGTDVKGVAGPDGESPLHVATRRRRESAIRILLASGADIDAKNAHGKTAYAHAARRGFVELVDFLVERGATTTLNEADQFAVAVVNGELDDARKVLAENPSVARTDNPAEDRLLADVAGRNPVEPVELLIGAGASLVAPGLNGGTPMHQAAWFGQPTNARLLIDAGAPLEIFDPTHESSPLGWAIHGSRYSGGAEERQDAFVDLVEMLLAAGVVLDYPTQPDSDAYFSRLLCDASPKVKTMLEHAR